MYHLSRSRRLRCTPFTHGVEAAGVKAYTVYNHMLLPTVFESLEADYRHLKTDVQVWDVSVQRQVEVRGPDAARLMQLLTPRDLRAMKPDQCYYAPIVDDAGGMLNDPVVLKRASDRWWISIADSDLLYWVKGIALGRGMDVAVEEPDVSPLAVQGPKAEDLMVRVFGDGVGDLRFFRWKSIPFEGRDLVVSRSGYSKQGGFEIYVEGRELGPPIWNALFESGQDLNVRAGCPNLIERIEGGLLSYGTDMTRENTPYECGLERYCSPPSDIEYIGKDALQTSMKSGPKRKICPLSISGGELPPTAELWPLSKGGAVVGQISSSAWSPDFQTHVAIGMIDAGYWEEDLELTAGTPEGDRCARVRKTFWA